MPPPEASAVDIVDNSAGPRNVANEDCKSTLVRNPVAPLAAGGAAAMGQRAALLAQFGGIPPAQVVVGGAARGTLTIDVYFAWLRGQVGGARLVARYDDGDGVPDWMLPGGGAVSYRWVQKISTNKPLGGPGNCYIDPRPGDDVAQGAKHELPYYWTDPEAIGTYTNGVNFDLRFTDTPSRACDQKVDWSANLFLISENNFTYPQWDATHVITIHDGISWGFRLDPDGQKGYIVEVLDTLIAQTFTPMFWGEGTGQTQQFGTRVAVELHPGGVPTVAPIVIQDSMTAQPLLHFGLLADYTFQVLIAGQQQLSVYVNDLDNPLSPLANPDQLAFNLEIPILQLPGVSTMSMTINLEDDLLVIVDENQPVRTDTALFVGNFSTFDPGLEGFTVLGMRVLNVVSTIDTICPWDLDGDREVGVVDFLDLLANWGPNPGHPADFDGNGNVGVTDFLKLLGNWGACPVPPEPQCQEDAHCDDGDPCTLDQCNEGTCSNMPVGPCCGNGVVEAGEACDPPGSESCPGGGVCLADCSCPPFACGPGAGGCCQVHPTPGCDNVTCCGAVCQANPLCCVLQWDANCVAQAARICGICGSQSNCCVAHPGPGCDDPQCQAAVCAVDPFCCQVQWDAICAGEAQQLCGDLCGGGGPHAAPAREAGP